MNKKKLKVIREKSKIHISSKWRSFNDISTRQNSLAEISNSMREMSSGIDHMLNSIQEIPDSFDMTKIELTQCSKQINTSIVNINNKYKELKEAIEENDTLLRSYREALILIKKNLNKIPKVFTYMINIINSGD